jgi:hypothetical protein
LFPATFGGFHRRPPKSEFMKSLRFISLASLLTGAFLIPAKASIVITAIESGGNVVFSFSGSVDTTGAPVPGGSFTLAAKVNPTVPLVEFGAGTSGNAQSYTVAASASGSFGPGGLTTPSSFTGDAFSYVGGASPRIDLPAGYTSNDLISGSMTFNGATFASMGISPVPSTYVFDMKLAGTGTVDQAVTLNVIPEPSSLALLGFAGFGLLRRRR